MTLSIDGILKCFTETIRLNPIGVDASTQLKMCLCRAKNNKGEKEKFSSSEKTHKNGKWRLVPRNFIENLDGCCGSLCMAIKSFTHTFDSLYEKHNNNKKYIALNSLSSASPHNSPSRQQVVEGRWEKSARKHMKKESINRSD